MEHSGAVLKPSFQALADVLDDFQLTATIDTARSLLERWVQSLDEEPMRSFLQAVAPERAFLPWWTEKCGGHVFSSGTRSIEWPAPIAERVGLQVALCRSISTKELDALQTAHKYFNPGTKYHKVMFAKMASDLLEPLLRDLRRLAEHRPIPSALSDLLVHRPRSTDAHLDALLDEACKVFRDSAPQSRHRAVEKLWDAWERAKTLHQGDKKASTAELLSRAAGGSEEFRRVLEDEAKALTDIGNDFHIRHHETNRSPLGQVAQVDYLFHRMLAMLAVVLSAPAPNR